MGATTASFLQSVGTAAFWFMVWFCLRDSVRPTRQPLFSRLAGLLIVIGLGFILLAFPSKSSALAGFGQNVAYAGVGVYLLRELVFMHYTARRLRRRARYLQQRAERAKQVAQGEERRPWLSK